MAENRRNKQNYGGNRGGGRGGPQGGGQDRGGYGQGGPRGGHDMNRGGPGRGPPQYNNSREGGYGRPMDNRGGGEAGTIREALLDMTTTAVIVVVSTITGLATVQGEAVVVPTVPDHGILVPSLRSKSSRSCRWKKWKSDQSYN